VENFCKGTTNEALTRNRDNGSPRHLAAKQKLGA